MNLLNAKEGEEYIVKDIATEDEELTAFLFSLGCYSGEPITVVSHLKGGCVVSIKDGRYNMDTDLAKKRTGMMRPDATISELWENTEFRFRIF